MIPRWRTIRLALLIALSWCFLLAPHPSAAQASAAMTGTAAPCAGYREPRVFLEGQGWWLNTGDAPAMAQHLHVGACVPLNQTVSGTVPIDVTIKLHNNPTSIRFVAFGTSGKMLQSMTGCYGYLSCVKYSSPIACSSMDCTFTVHIDAPTQAIATDGRTELQIAVNGVRPDGKPARAAVNWFSTLANQHPVSNSTWPWEARGEGWTAATKYSTGAIGNIPVAPVSGTWIPSFRTLNMGGLAGMGAPVTEYDVRVDPNFHMGIPGTIIAAGAGPLTSSLLINTTQFANGPHKLFFRVGSHVAAGTNSGVIIVPFTVQN